jgi:hypothetical protein
MAHAAPTTTLPTASENHLPLATIPTLNPKINRPVGVTEAVGAWKRLQQIEHIEVMPVSDASANESFYTISVFLHHTRNHIPINNLGSTTSAVTSGRPRAIPDLQIVRSISELSALRQSVRSSVCQYHPVYCDLCDSLAVRMLTTLAQPSLLSAAICLSKMKGAKQIRAYLGRVLAHLDKKKDRCAPTCKAQRDLPLLLHNFLFG